MKFKSAARLLGLGLGLMTFPLLSVASDSEFLGLCEHTLSNSPEKKLCSEIHNVFFKDQKSKPLVYINPKLLNVEEMSIDKKVDYIIFNDPNFLNGVAYCYFVFKGWISPVQMSPDTLGTSATGFSILNEDLKDYQKWLNTSVEAKKCKTQVQKDSEVSVSNLDTYLKDKVAIIGLNPYGVIQTPGINLSKALEELQTTVNHERIHAYQASCPAFEKWSMDQWANLPVKEKNQYINKHTSYTWSIPKVAGREYIGYLYEKTPSKLEAHFKNCTIK